jgi:hypothetical protein
VVTRLSRLSRRWCTPRPAPVSGSRHTCSAYHRDLVDAYRAAREAAEQARERVTLGYPSELRDHPPIITFRTWLEQTSQADHAGDHAADQNAEAAADDEDEDGWWA